MSKIEKNIIDLLQEFGLSVNASKTYVTLLKNNPSTGYEISIQSGIPRSAIYAVLRRLESIGLVNSIGGTSKKYVPLSPSSLLEHFNHLHTDRSQSLNSALEKLDTDDEAFDFWHMHGYRNLILKIKEEIRNASEYLFLSAWNKEVLAVEQELEAADKRGVKITLFSFCRLDHSFGQTISYNIDENEIRDIWNPKVIMVKDHSVTVMGRAVDRSENRAIWTNNNAITEIAINHIILDITLAGQRLNFDPNPIVQPMMRRSDIKLDKLLNLNSIHS